ncbi:MULTISPECIES: MaoC/PaaZ C-terminal domain-containing protein [unclassified Nocardioides]|uniref:MaoC/PaaZ C-terminal domain-containing protein n=1 Tax=unclassified Nocardioides TaxID=2615069 RepID=UPI0006F1E6A3|nr:MULTISPECIES: MaoC/PaaZ C-terminal domain-containing protein [unclassified Nocardioides]KRA28014.1 dehydratase [Nocardioides sp. Root614]KRA85989.1 dehydratase [Nocardioides sp. Root682]
MADSVEFDDAGLGVWTDPETFEVTAERIAAYAEATNDPIAAHRAGEVASPVFAIVPVFESMLAPVLDVVPTRYFGLAVHGEQDFHFHRAIRPGDVLVSRARMTGYEGLPNGTRAAIHLECRNEEGELVNEQFATVFFRGIDAGEAVGDLTPAHKFDAALRDKEPAASIGGHVDDDQTFRYSPASGDPMPIHLDEQVALDSGLPGIIAHGLCTMAFASWAVLSEVGESDTTRLRRLAVRFSKMVRPGDDLTTRMWETGTADGVTSYAFETSVGDDVVLTDGLAEFDNKE